MFFQSNFAKSLEWLVIAILCQRRRACRTFFYHLQAGMTTLNYEGFNGPIFQIKPEI